MRHLHSSVIEVSLPRRVSQCPNGRDRVTHGTMPCIHSGPRFTLLCTLMAKMCFKVFNRITCAISLRPAMQFARAVHPLGMVHAEGAQPPRPGRSKSASSGNVPKGVGHANGRNGDVAAALMPINHKRERLCGMPGSLVLITFMCNSYRTPSTLFSC